MLYLEHTGPNFKIAYTTTLTEFTKEVRIRDDKIDDFER